MAKFEMMLVLALLQAYAMVETSAVLPNLGKNIKGMETINGSMYFFSPVEEKLNIAEAFEMCEGMDMQMVSFQTWQKEDMIVEFMKASEYANSLYWTSGTRYFHTSQFIWSATGEIIKRYTNWGVGQPNEVLSFPSVCIYLNYGSYTWQDADCDTNIFGVICEEKNKCF